MQKAIGIDSIGVYVPRLYVDLTGEWARVRAPLLSQGDVGKLVGKVTDGVGVTRMAVPDAHEDCATMAAMAAKRAIDAAQIDPRDVDYLAVGTETTVDQSKSAAAYVLGMLERHYGVSMAEVGAPQFQFACIGATYALEAAVSRIRAGDNTKPYSLVIASDVSKYPLGTAGEYTQGAGAVALLVSENPRILSFERGLSATVTRDERDFFRPNWSGAAVVDGKYSVDVYLDCVEAAFSSYASRLKPLLGASEVDVMGAIDHFLFHVPFPRMAEYAAARVFTSQWLLDPAARARLAEQVPLVLDRPSGDARKWRRDLERAVARSPHFRAAYDLKVASSLTLAQSVGNVYSGSLYLALAGLFERSRGQPLAGHRVAFASYGSGASAKVFSGIVGEQYEATTRRLRIHDELRPEAEGGRRVPLSVDEYERLHGLADCELEGDPTKPVWRVRARGASVRPPSGEFALDRLGTTSSPELTDVGYRYYAWVAGGAKQA
jgi:hydroxymethylglutaryl-CoA synthase